MTSKQLAEQLIENWACGTDLLERLPDWVIQDLRDKAEGAFEYLRTEMKEEAKVKTV